MLLHKHFNQAWKIALLLFVIHLVSFKANAESSVGFILGDPTGISTRFFHEKEYSISLTFANHGGDNEGLEIQASILKNKARLFAIEKQAAELYYGAGIRLIDISEGKHKNELALALRTPIGVSVDISNPDLQFFAELAPNLNLSPFSEIDFDLGIGCRFRF